MLDLLRGIKVSGKIVAFTRGLIEVGLMAAVGEAIVLLDAVEWGELLPVAPVVFFALRQLEGVIDDIDPAKQRKPDV